MILDRSLIYSILGHVALITFMIIKVSFFSKPTLNLSQAIRVDMVGLPEKIRDLPEKTLPEKAEPQPKPLPEKPIENLTEKLTEKPIEKKTQPIEKLKPEVEPAISLSKRKLKQKEALEKLKKLAALEKIKNLVSESKNSSANKAPIQGKALAQGSAVVGLDRILSEQYLLQLDSLIKDNWKLPQYLIGKSFKARVLVKFNPEGKILDKKIVQSSGNLTYDDYCLQAIENSSPFPKVPEKFTEIYSSDGVIIGFPE